MFDSRRCLGHKPSDLICSILSMHRAAITAK
nr:MAG TPA: hypothetical protein [Caudoviricetes sp.]